MAIWSSSSLGFSDHNNLREKSGLLKNLKTRISKQHIVEHKMFGSKRKGIRIGKKFKGKGKDIIKKPTSAYMEGDLKSKGISPSVADFDKMMDNLTKNSSMNKNRRMSFSRKSFG